MMKIFKHWSRQAVALLCGLLLASASLQAEDIDIFVGNTTVDSGLPNVIFVLDNTANWARQSQGWPGGLTQGQSEVRAIKTALADLEDRVNVGFVMFTTEGNANQDGGYVRHHLQKLTPASRSSLSGKLDSIFNNINAPIEKRNANTPFGNLMFDTYNYLTGGAQSYAGAGTPNLADPLAYTSKYGQFASPLTSDSVCGKTYLIFIGNPGSSGPTNDSSTNSGKLAALYAAAGVSPVPDGMAGTSGSPAPIALPGFSVTTVTEPPTKLGYSKACYKTTDVAACTTAQNAAGGLCAGKENCACDVNDTITTGGIPACVTSGQAKNRTFRMQAVVSGVTTTVVTESGVSDTTSGRAWNLDDWAKFLNQQGVPVTVEVDGDDFEQRVPVITYTIDVFNKQQNPEHSALLFSAAKMGGGRYFQAKDESAIVDAIQTALSDILSVSSTFAAVTLPLSSTNRAQSKNQVYIGMFRPDQAAKPRWFGNLKRYQIGIFDGEPGLADAKAKQAINPISGFAAECSESFWSSASGSYWKTLGITPPPVSQCLETGVEPWSDLPDGPFVEKGGAAQVSRNSTLTARKLLTTSGTALANMTNATAVGGTSVLNYLKGTQVGVDETAGSSNGRPSIHGDVVHSRPLTVNYGGSKGTYIYYGSNDGLYRSVRASSGLEAWSLIAPEHYSGIQRLYDNSPAVLFPNQPEGSGAESKDYFFDGSTGYVVSYDANDAVDLAWIFPTMRRGGRMVYGLNVTDPADPKLLWRLGCPSLENDTGCSAGFSGIGQTWSVPTSTLLAGHSASAPALVFGGGYDTCLDKDQVAYPCSSSAKGRGIYVLNAQDGTLLAGPSTLPTDGPVVGDVALVDINQDGKTDFAYASDAKGGLYRISFAKLSGDEVAALPPAEWSIVKLAQMDGNSRRFMNAPVTLAVNGVVYIALGSGNRERPLESNYPYKEDVDDRFYMFADAPARIAPSTINLDGTLLADVTYDATKTGAACEVRGARGWRTRLDGRGEQVVNPAAMAGGKVFFNTYRPGGSSTGVCTRPLGIATGWNMSLFNPSPCDEDRSKEVAGGGMPIAPVITSVCVGCNAGVPKSDGTTEYDDPDHVAGSTVAVVDDPNNPGGTTTKDVTVCIGCDGLTPIGIEAEPPGSRRRSYFSIDVDR